MRHRCRTGACAFSALCLGVISCAANATDEGACAPMWVAGFGAPHDGAGSPQGLNGPVYALVVFDDGSGGGPALYAGGAFTNAGGVVVSNIARWDGASWEGVGGGLNGGVNALIVFDDGHGDGPVLYAGGWFADDGDGAPNRVARWDGSSWTGVGLGMDDEVFSLVLANYGQSGTGIDGDVNGDGAVDFADFSLVLANYGVVCR